MPSELPSTDEELMDAWCHGDRQSLVELIGRHEDSVRRWLTVWLRDRHLAEDATQEVFLSLYRFPGNYRPEIPFKGWLHIVVRNCTTNFLRTQRRSVPADPYEDDFPGTDREPVDDAIDAERAAIARAVTWELEPLSRDAIRMHYLDELSCEEIAVATGQGVNRIKGKLSRARAYLRDLLEGRGL